MRSTPAASSSTEGASNVSISSACNAEACSIPRCTFSFRRTTVSSTWLILLRRERRPLLVEEVMGATTSGFSRDSGTARGFFRARRTRRSVSTRATRTCEAEVLPASQRVIAAVPEQHNGRNAPFFSPPLGEAGPKTHRGPCDIGVVNRGRKNRNRTAMPQSEGRCRQTIAPGPGDGRASANTTRSRTAKALPLEQQTDRP